MKFAHISDSHLGGWRQPELQKLNLESFKYAIDTCIQENVDFILFTGDLFDSAFPPIEILKEAFYQFRRLKDAKIKSYIIAGSHDYSVSGKTFLDVLEKAGFCEIAKYEENEEEIRLLPITHEAYYIYGYPGKKSGLEIDSLKKIKIKEPYESKFRILMLHTTITEAIANLPIESIQINDLPIADYYALGHIHIDFNKSINDKPVIYGGPTFPNNFKEFEELKNGFFYIIDVSGFTEIIKKEIKLKETEKISLEIDDALNATEYIINQIAKRDIRDKVVLLKIYGTLKKGKPSDIKFQKIIDFVKEKEAYSFLKNTSKLETEKKEIEVNLQSKEMEKIEELLIKDYEKQNPSKLNEYIFPLMESLSIEKQEDEKNISFEGRLFSELEKVLKIDLKSEI